MEDMLRAGNGERARSFHATSRPTTLPAPNLKLFELILLIFSRSYLLKHDLLIHWPLQVIQPSALLPSPEVEGVPTLQSHG